MKFRILLLIFLFAITSLIYAQGCMEASSDEGVNVVGYIQAQYEYMSQDPADDISKFTFNRFRFGLMGNIPYDFSYYSLFEFSPNKDGAPYLLDGFITYSRLDPYLKISLGQFKSPFSLELNTPCQGLHTIKRSEVVNTLTSPDRDRGVLFNGHYKEMLKYAFSFTNGTGRDSLENNQNKVFAGRAVVTPIEFLSLGAGYKTGTSPPLEATAEKEDEMTRMSIDAEIKYGDLLVQGEYITGEDTGSHLEPVGDD
ncbi:MAG: OprO/OprP family phosphate-selective porin [Candidatus Cloacimonetes bacterium]|nr:OprO/OprP family phosphate-selective porin [Candidatus Cloacimonadota bacterium]